MFDRLFRLLIVCAGIAMAFGATPSAAQTFYGSAYNGRSPPSPATFYTISTTTGGATAIGAIGFNQVGALDFAPSMVLYGIGKNAGGTQQLLTINTTTGAATSVASLGNSNFFDMAFRPADGALYALDFDTLNGVVRVGRIDTATGAVTTLSSLPNAEGNALAFSSSNVLYYATDTALSILDQTTGGITSTIPLTYPVPSSRANGMKFDPTSGTLYASVTTGFGAGNYLATVDTTNGTVTMVGSTQAGLDAIAIPRPLPLTLTLAGSGSGLVTSNPAGINCGAACSASFQQGTQVILTATAGSGSMFSGWSGGGCSGTLQCTVTVDTAKSVTARFDPIPSFALTVAKSGAGSGTVMSAPSGIDCGAVCAASFQQGTVVTLTQSVAPGSVFAGWGGACSGVGGCTVTMSAAQSVTAMFGKITRTLTVSETGAGQVTSAPPGITCSPTSSQCSAGFADGTAVTLTAAANTGWSFTGWSGGGCSGANACALTLSADTAVRATFTQNPPSTSTLSLALAGSGGGTVTSTRRGSIVARPARPAFRTACRSR